MALDQTETGMPGVTSMIRTALNRFGEVLDVPVESTTLISELCGNEEFLGWLARKHLQLSRR